MAYKRKAFINIKVANKQLIGQQQQPEHNIIQIKEGKLTKIRP